MLDSLIPDCRENPLRRFLFTFTVVELGVDFTELELDQLAVKNLMRLDWTELADRNNDTGLNLRYKNSDTGLTSIGTFAFYRTLKGQLWRATCYDKLHIITSYML